MTTALTTLVTTRPARPDAAATHRMLRTICAAGLMVGAGVHLNVGLAHVGSNFGTLSLIAAAVQCALGAAIFVGRVSTVANAAVIVDLVLLQLYVLNVTIGLPPVIAHVHGDGTHVVLGYTFAQPNTVDFEGVIAAVTEITAAASASLLLRAR